VCVHSTTHTHTHTLSHTHTHIHKTNIRTGVTGIDPYGKVTENWYPILPTGRMSQLYEGVSQFGELHLRLKFSRPPVSLAHPSLEPGEDVESPGGLDDSEIEELEHHPPNELVVNCVAGHNLLAGKSFVCLPENTYIYIIYMSKHTKRHNNFIQSAHQNKSHISLPTPPHKPHNHIPFIIARLLSHCLCVKKSRQASIFPHWRNV